MTSGGASIVLQTITGNGTISVPFTWNGGTLYVQFYSNYNATLYANSFSAEDVMICTVADYKISPAFVPYRPSWQEMYEMIKALQSGGASTQSVQPALMSAANTDDLQKDEIQIETEAEE